MEKHSIDWFFTFLLPPPADCILYDHPMQIMFLLITSFLVINMSNWRRHALAIGPNKHGEHKRNQYKHEMWNCTADQFNVNATPLRLRSGSDLFQLCSNSARLWINPNSLLAETRFDDSLWFLSDLIWISLPCHFDFISTSLRYHGDPHRFHS